MACKCCAQPLVTIPVILTFLAMIATWYFTFSCDFFDVGKESYGFYLLGVSDAAGEPTTCWIWGSIPTDPSIPDKPILTGRALGTIASALSLLAFVMVLIPCCVSFSTRTYYFVMSFLGVVEASLSAASFYVLESEYCPKGLCTMGWGAIICIVAAVLWAIMGIVFLAIPVVRDRRETQHDTTAVAPLPTTNVTREVKPDGTVVVTKTTTNPDGSKTVTVESDIEQGDEEMMYAVPL